MMPYYYDASFTDNTMTITTYNLECLLCHQCITAQTTQFSGIYICDNCIDRMYNAQPYDLITWIDPILRYALQNTNDISVHYTRLTTICNLLRQQHIIYDFNIKLLNNVFRVRIVGRGNYDPMELIIPFVITEHYSTTTTNYVEQNAKQILPQKLFEL